MRLAVLSHCQAHVRPTRTAFFCMVLQSKNKISLAPRWTEKDFHHWWAPEMRMDFFSSFFLTSCRRDVILTRGVYKSTAVAAIPMGAVSRKIFRRRGEKERERGEPQKTFRGDSFIFRRSSLSFCSSARRSRDERDSPHVGPQNTRALVWCICNTWRLGAGPRLDFVRAPGPFFIFFLRSQSRNRLSLYRPWTSLLLLQCFAREFYHIYGLQLYV